MARLPQPGNDAGQWGEILNDFLLQSLNADGSLKSVSANNVVGLDAASSSLIRDPASAIRTALSDTVLADMVNDVTLVNDHLIFHTYDGQQIDLGSIRGATGPKGDVGDAGAVGSQGNPGATGAAGPANSLSIGTVTKLSPGATPTATITGTAPSQTLALGLVTGDTGAQGPRGDLIPYQAATTWTGAINLDTLPFPVVTKPLLTGNITLSLSNRTAGSDGGTIVLCITQGTAGNYTVTHPTTVKWTYGVKPVHPTGPSLTTEYIYEWNGIEWIGRVGASEYA